METTRNSIIMVMKLVESVIGLEAAVTVQGSECHFTFVRGRLHITEKDPHINHINFLNDDFKRSTRYPCLSSLLESRLAL